MIDFERHCAEIVAQTAQLTAHLDDAGPDAQMWCPVDGGGSKQRIASSWLNAYAQINPRSTQTCACGDGVSVDR